MAIERFASAPPTFTSYGVDAFSVGHRRHRRANRSCTWIHNRVAGNGSMMHPGGSTTAVCIKYQPGVAFDSLFEDKHVSASNGDHIVTRRGARKLQPVRGQEKAANRMTEQVD